MEVWCEGCGAFGLMVISHQRGVLVGEEWIGTGFGELRYEDLTLGNRVYIRVFFGGAYFTVLRYPISKKTNAIRCNLHLLHYTNTISCCNTLLSKCHSMQFLLQHR